jgi:hypothetical protein
MRLSLPTPGRRLKRILAVLLVLAAYVGATALIAYRYSDLPVSVAPRFQVHGQWVYRDGEKFFVNAVGWDPTRPGNLPWKWTCPPDLVEEDFARIRAAGFNTVRTWTALSQEELSAAERHGLAVIQGIWVDRTGDFSDRAFRERQLAEVARVARYSRESKAVLAYLVMNEPSATHVLKQGIETTRSLLREVARTIRTMDPGAIVGFSNWPGVEFLDEPELDLVAANLYPFRPKVLLEAIGYEGMLQLWTRRLAKGRPFLASEYGISVAPGRIKPESPGGATEEQQASELPRLADAIVRSGAIGGSVFMWIDGWWKNADASGDELTHDPADGEEWFGLNAMERIDDHSGRPRPALQAMRDWSRAVLTLPADGPVPAREVEVEVYTEEQDDLSLEVEVNGAAPLLVPTVREGAWLRGRLGLATRASGPQRLAFTVQGQRGGLIAHAERVVVPPGQAPSLSLSVQGSGPRRTVLAKVLDGAGKPLAGAEVRLAMTEASHRLDWFRALKTDGSGQAKMELEVPTKPAIGLLVGAVRAEGVDMPLALDACFVPSGSAP